MRTRFCLTLLLAISIGAAGLGAQGTTVSGVVRDSLAHTALANATVQLIAADNPARFERSATSDSLGRFVLTDVPLGRYMLGFFHPVLDLLGVEAPLREVYVDSYQPVIADVAVPGPARLRAAICGARTVQDSGGVIIGVVRDVTTGRAASGVTVEGQWLELSLGRGGLSRRIARTKATTSVNGWYSLCDVPTIGTIVMVASKGSDSTGTIEVQLPSDALLRRELYLGATTTEVVTAAPVAPNDSSRGALRIRIGNGRLSGTVVTAAGSKPLANAQVSITNGPQTRTDERGEWTISNAPPGTRMLEVRALGYYPDTRYVDVVADAPPVRVALSTFKAVLDTVKIIARRNPAGPDGGEFLARRRRGIGHFITAQDMVTHPVITTSDVFRRIPGVRSDFKSSMIQVRGAFEDWCNASVYINGMYMRNISAEDIDDFVYPHEVAGIEVYTESNVPPQFQPGLNGCGSIVIWTK